MNHIIGVKVVKANDAIPHNSLNIFFFEEFFVFEASFKYAVILIP